MRKHNNTFDAHPDIIPAARVVLKRQIFLIVLRVVRRDRRFVLHISGDVLPINNLVLDGFAVADEFAGLGVVAVVRLVCRLVPVFCYSQLFLVLLDLSFERLQVGSLQPFDALQEQVDVPPQVAPRRGARVIHGLGVVLTVRVPQPALEAVDLLPDLVAHVCYVGRGGLSGLVDVLLAREEADAGQ